jgi:hypothetical protein
MAYAKNAEEKTVSTVLKARNTALCAAPDLPQRKNSKQRRMIKMKVNVIRGKNQIGGNIIEISTEKTKILLDAGLVLDNDNQDELPEIPELFEYAGYDAVFVSHYHGDHLGLVYNAHKDIPIYIGENAYNVIKASDNYKGIETFTPKGFLRNKEEIIIGDMTVTPFLCDHSAFSAAFLAAAILSSCCRCSSWRCFCFSMYLALSSFLTSAVGKNIVFTSFQILQLAFLLLPPGV